MPVVRVNRECGHFGRVAPVASSWATGEDSAAMSDASSNLGPDRQAVQTDSDAPRLRLTGTSAGPVGAEETALLELRATLVRTISANERDADLVRVRLERASRTDPIREVTGRDAFEANRTAALGMLEAVDARLATLDADRASVLIETLPSAGDLLRRR